MVDGNVSGGRVGAPTVGGALSYVDVLLSAMLMLTCCFEASWKETS